MGTSPALPVGSRQSAVGLELLAAYCLLATVSRLTDS